MSDHEKQQKEIAFYSALVNGWLSTRLEHDKSKLSLSTAAIGLLVTLLIAFGVSSVTVYVMYVIAFIAFLVTIICVVIVFNGNAEHLEKVLAGEESRNKHLQNLDRISNYLFIVGMLFTLIIGLVVGFDSLQKNEVKTMSDVKVINTGTETIKKSWDGIFNMKPSPQNNGDSSSQQFEQQQEQPQAEKKE